MRENRTHGLMREGRVIPALYSTRNIFKSRYPRQETAISARRDNWEYESYLLELAEREREARRNARTARLLKDSKLPLEKNLKAFNRSGCPERWIRN